MSESWRRVALVSDGFEILVNFMRPGSALPAHAHRHRQLGYCFSGRVQLSADGALLPLGRGDSYLLGSEVEHGATIDQDAVCLDVKYCAAADRSPAARVTTPGMSHVDGEARYRDPWLFVALVQSPAALQRAARHVRELPSAHVVAVDRSGPVESRRAAIFAARQGVDVAHASIEALVIDHHVLVIGHRPADAAA